MAKNKPGAVEIARAIFALPVIAVLVWLTLMKRGGLDTNDYVSMALLGIVALACIYFLATVFFRRRK